MIVQSDNALFVLTNWRAIFETDPAQPLLDYWAGLLDAGTLTQGEALRQWLADPVYHRLFVKRVWTDFFGSPPSPERLEYFAGFLDRGQLTTAQVYAQWVSDPLLQGNQPARRVAIARVSDPSILLTPRAPVFRQQVDDTLGNAGTNTDGFDAVILTPLLAFEGDVASLSELDGHLSAMDFTDGEFRSGNIDPIVADTQPFIDSGDVIINAPAAGPPAPSSGGSPSPISNPPAPAPSPVIGGSGGGPAGGGGGDRPGYGGCIEGDEYPFCDPDRPIL